MSATSQLTVLAVWVWGNAEKVLRETPPSCSNLPTKSFPFSEKVFMPPSRHGKVASLIFRPGYGQYEIALFYSQGQQGTISTLLWIRTDDFMDRVVDLEWLSAFPHEKEYLYPPLSFLKPIQTGPTVLEIGSCLYQVVEPLKISMS